MLACSAWQEKLPLLAELHHQLLQVLQHQTLGQY
jgi:hypothetical protein